MNSGSTTYVMKPGGRREAADGDDAWRAFTNHKRNRNVAEVLTYLNFPNCVGLPVTKRADFKLVLLLNIT